MQENSTSPLTQRERRRETLRKYNAKYRLAHPERGKSDKALYVERHPEKVKAYKHLWYISHLPQNRTQAAAYRESHRDYARKYMVTYYPEHKDKFIEGTEIRRARKAIAPIVERISRQKVFDRDNGICHICHEPVDPSRWDLDHLISLKLGGEHSYRNVSVSHPICNRRKNAFGPAQLRLF